MRRLLGLGMSLEVSIFDRHHVWKSADLISYSPSMRLLRCWGSAGDGGA